MDKKTQIVTSVEEKCGDEVFYGYNVEFDGQKKVPVFYQKLEKEKRVCTVYSDYNGENNQVIKYMKTKMVTRNLRSIRCRYRIRKLIFHYM